MIATTAYILISTPISQGNVTQSTSTFADQTLCESAATRLDFIYKDMRINGKWNLTCHPYQLNEIKK
jgi:multimeric flavodoxin WrbA